MKILLTGYKGFIGKNFLNNPSFMRHDIYLYEWGDKDLPIIKGLDWVLHIGGISSTTASWADADNMNRKFTIWLYEECIKYNVNMQYSSSASVYGNSNTTFRESDKVNPESFYAQSKADIERYIEEHPSSIIVQGFRYFNVYGPFEDHKGDMASPYHKFRKQAQNGIIKIFEGSDKYKRDFVHVDNIIDVHMAFIEIKESGVWNVGTGNAKSFLDVAKEIQRETNANIEYIPFPKKLKQQYQEYTQADLTKLTQTLKKNIGRTSHANPTRN